MKVLLVEEYAERERLALSVLKKTLEEAGHVATLTNAWAVETDNRTFRPDLVVDNISDSLAHYVGKLSMLNTNQRNVNLIWEQLVSPANLLRYRFEDSLCTRFVDGRTSWGPAFKAILEVENPMLDPERIAVTGSMKHSVIYALRDIPKEELWCLFPYDFTHWDRVVLIAESFPTPAIPGPRKLARTNSAPVYAWERAEYVQRMRTEYIITVQHLAESYPNCLFILRVHPGKEPEHRARYQAALHRENVRVNADGDIGPLLRVVDLLIASSSGALVDAHVMGVPAVNAIGSQPIDEIPIFYSLADKLGWRMTMQELRNSDLEALMFRPTNPSEYQQSLIDQWLGPIGKHTFVNVVAFLEEIMRYPSLPKSPPARAYLHWPSVRRMIRNNLRRRGWAAKPFESGPFQYDRVLELMREASVTV